MTPEYHGSAGFITTKMNSEIQCMLDDARPSEEMAYAYALQGQIDDFIEMARIVMDVRGTKKTAIQKVLPVGVKMPS